MENEIITMIRNNILNLNRNYLPSGNHLVSSRYYNDPPRGGYQVNEEHEYIITDNDDIASLVLLEVLTNLSLLNDPKTELQQRNDRIKELKYRKIKETNDLECSICLDNFKKGECYRTLDCNHCFHKKCIDRWFKKNNDGCPMCRTKII